MTDDDLTRLRDEVAVSVMDAQCAACGHEAGDHSWYGPCLVNVTNYDDACPCRHSREHVYADALLPLLARKIAEARGDALRVVRLVESDMAERAMLAWRSADARRGLSDHEALIVHADALTRWSERFRMAFEGEDWAEGYDDARAGYQTRNPYRAALAEPTGPDGER